MISWGIVAALTAAVTTPRQFYAARFALGLAEAGFFPGIIVYLTHWFPSRDRARALAFLLLAQPFAYIIGPPLSYPLLRIGTDESRERPCRPPSGGPRPPRMAVGVHRLGIAQRSCSDSWCGS